MSVHFQNPSTQTSTTFPAVYEAVVVSEVQDEEAVVVSEVQDEEAVVVSEVQDEPEEEKIEIGKPISCAETTRVFVDETARKTLKGYGKKQIKSWVGRDLHKTFEGTTKSISIRNARMINQKAGAEIIKLNEENIDRFTVDPIIFERLGHIKLTKASRELGILVSELHEFKGGRIRTIAKEQAEKYNEYFKKMNTLPQTEIFDSKRIFQLALVEPISEKGKKLSEHTWITIEDKHREELIDLPDRAKLYKWVGRKFSNICLAGQTMSIKDAVLIHKISGKIIFTFNKEALAKIPIFPAHLDELKRLIQRLEEEGKTLDPEVLKKAAYFKKANPNCIDRELAEKINSCLGKDVFDCETILAQAVQEAEDEVKEMQFSLLPKKRKREDSTASTEDSSLPNSKKQRTGEDEKKAAMPSQMPPAPDEPPELALKSKHDLSYILN